MFDPPFATLLAAEAGRGPAPVIVFRRPEPTTPPPEIPATTPDVAWERPAPDIPRGA
jgi:hypothetical protein